jgi:site-specific DNA recombinase
MEKEEKNKKQICAIYTRVSTEEQARGSDFTSMDSQREYAESYIKSQESLGWELCTEKYDDPGYTGGNIERPGLRKLLSDAKKGKFNVIVIYKIDRLTRSLNDFGKLWDIFEKYEISFVSVTQKFDTTTSMGRLMLHILLSFSQFEREINSERTRDKMLASAKRGKWICGYPGVGYDYDSNIKKLVVNKEEVSQVNFTFKTYLRLKSALETAKIVNARGYRTKAWVSKGEVHKGGHTWTKNRIKDFLRNPVYIGKIRYKGEIYAGEHPAIVDEKLFNQVQLCMDRNGKRKNSPFKNHRHEFLLTGLVRCTYCGSKMTTNVGCSRGRTYLYYGCTKVAKNDRTACKYRRVPAKQLEGVVIERIKFLADSPQIVEKIVKKISANVESELPDLMDKLNSKLRKQEEAGNNIENLKRCILEKLDAKQSVDALIRDREEQEQSQKELARETDILRLKINELKSRVINSLDIQNNFRSFKVIFDKLDYGCRKELLGLLIKEIRYNGDKSQIEIDFYHLPDISSEIWGAICFDARTEKGGETHPNLTTNWLTDSFVFRAFKAENGLKWGADWGYPPR